MNTTTQIASLAAKLLRVLEGCKLDAYWDEHGKVWTIGFGRAHGISKGMTITFDQAVQFLAEDCAPLIELVKDRPVVEAAALVSFGYNCGEPTLRRVLTGEIQVTPEGFRVGDDPYGELSGGKRILLPRRQLEAALIWASRGA